MDRTARILAIGAFLLSLLALGVIRLQTEMIQTLQYQVRSLSDAQAGH